MTPIPYPYSEALLSVHSNLFTYQWRHLRAFVKKLWIHFFSLGQKIFLSTPNWLPAHNLNTNIQGGCTSTRWRARFLLWLSRLKWWRAFVHQNTALFQLLYEYTVFSKWELYSCLLIYPLILICSYLGTHRKMPRTNTNSEHLPFTLTVALCMCNMLQKVDT